MSVRSFAAAIAAAVLAGASATASAETNEVRFSQQFGLLYLPMHVVVDRKLVESCAKRDGLGDIKVSMHRFSGGAAINQALLSGNVDFGAGGIGPLLIIWDKTKGNLNVRAMSNIAAMPMKLNTIDPNVQKLEDYLDVEDHKMALPSVKVSGQARTLQMAAAKLWGQDNFDKLDHVTVSMKHPSAAAALLAGGQTVKSHFATLPTSYRELKSGKVRTLLTSYDVFGGRHTIVSMYNREQWKKDNPRLYECVWKSFREAIAWINEDKKRGAELFHRFTKSKMELEEVIEMTTTPGEVDYLLEPERTIQLAEFLHSVGAISQMPESWKDYYWENNYDLDGS